MTALTQEQTDDLQDYLDSLDIETRDLGLRCFEKGQVTDVEPYKRGIGFRAEILGRTPYCVKLRFVNGEWDAECSCPRWLECKHCCAAALQVMAAFGGASPLADADPRPAAPAVAPRGKLERPKDAKVSALFADRLGRKLTSDENRVAEAVDELFRRYRGAGYVTESLLETITGSRAA